jgi:hypothetical protein
MDDDERRLIEAGYIKTTLWLTPDEVRMVRAVVDAMRKPSPDGMPPPLSPSERKAYKRLKGEIDLPKKKPPEGGS